MIQTSKAWINNSPLSAKLKSAVSFQPIEAINVEDSQVGSFTPKNNMYTSNYDDNIMSHR